MNLRRNLKWAHSRVKIPSKQATTSLQTRAIYMTLNLKILAYLNGAQFSSFQLVMTVTSQVSWEFRVLSKLAKAWRLGLDVPLLFSIHFISLFPFPLNWEGIREFSSPLLEWPILCAGTLSVFNFAIGTVTNGYRFALGQPVNTIIFRIWFNLPTFWAYMRNLLVVSFEHDALFGGGRLYTHFVSETLVFL